MKFYCDACNTKYAISDEKVRGKVLKVRCKNCGTIITVREAVAPMRSLEAQSDPTITSPTSPPTHSSRVPQQDWYYALNGQTFGPFSLDGLRRKYSSAEIGDATYVWHEQLGAWKPVGTEPAFAEALALGQKIVPSRKTLGFDGPVQAIRVTQTKLGGEQVGVVPAAVEPKPQPEPKPVPRPEPKAEPRRTTPPPKPQRTPVPKQSSGVGAAARPALPVTAEQPKAPAHKPAESTVPAARPLKDVRERNLDRLRAKLGGLEESSEPGALSSSKEPADDSGEGLPRPVGGEAVFTFADGVTPASAQSSQELQVPRLADNLEKLAKPRPADAMNFALPPRAKPAKPSPSSTSDILEVPIGPMHDPPPSEASEVEDSGLIPFSPEAFPVAASAPAYPSPTPDPASSTSESLLVDMKSMNVGGRKRGIGIAVLGGLLLVGLLAIAVVLAQDSEPEPMAQTPTPPKVEHKDELVIPTYSKAEVGKIATLNLEDELLFGEEEVTEGDEGEPLALKTPAKEEPAAKAARKVEIKKASKPATKKTEPPKNKVAVASASTAAQTTGEPAEPVDPLAALLAPRANRTTEIKAPEDKLRTQQNEGLSKDQARRGFQRVKKSIRDCRERHNRYNAKLDAGKLKISVTVDPSGNVSTFTLNPRSVQNTEFANCMQSHQGRWRFASFTGKPVVINTSVIIQ